jgi:hypothetical protein
MKSDTFWLGLKGLGLIGGNITAAYVTGISQWANEGRWPDPINWHLIVAGALSAGFIALVAFSSGSAEKWRQARSGNEATNKPE